MKHEYVALKKLEEIDGWKVLNALWIHQISKIEEGRDKAAARGTESAWRYWAGQEKGFKLAMTALARAVLQMEKEDDIPDENSPEMSIQKLLEEVRPK